jgi:hypothetical protein
MPVQHHFQNIPPSKAGTGRVKPGIVMKNGPGRLLRGNAWRGRAQFRPQKGRGRQDFTSLGQKSIGKNFLGLLGE